MVQCVARSLSDEQCVLARGHKGPHSLHVYDPEAEPWLVGLWDFLQMRERSLARAQRAQWWMNILLFIAIGVNVGAALSNLFHR